MKYTYVIDGRQLLTGVKGGVQRYIFEIVTELDKICNVGEFELLIPNNTKIDFDLKKIKIVNYGRLKGLLWEQICLPIYLIKNKKKGIYPCSIVPLLYDKGIAVVHDIMAKSNKVIRKSFPLVFRILLLINYRTACKKTDHVITDSNFSANEIKKIYHIDDSRISVIYDAWQHMNRIIPDDKWMQKYPELKKGEFFFSLSANRVQKNFKWIYEMAKKYPDYYFAIAGTVEERQKNLLVSAPNIIQLGYISDGEVKSLFMNCRAFLFPSFCEGFGMPPLEALSCGSKIVVANASCLPEVYGKSAYYIEPFDYTVDLDELLEKEVENPVITLKKYSWEQTAKKIYEICINL